MSMDIFQAQKLVEDKILNGQCSCAILEGETLELDFGWVFFYQAKDYIKSGEISKMLGGNAPVLVDKNTNQLFITGTAYPIERYIKAYSECGDPHADLSSHIEVYGWENGANKVETMKFIKSISGMGLKESKIVVDRALENKASIIVASSPSEATKAVKIIKWHKFKCRQLWSNQC